MHLTLTQPAHKFASSGEVICEALNHDAVCSPGFWNVYMGLVFPMGSSTPVVRKWKFSASFDSSVI